MAQPGGFLPVRTDDAEAPEDASPVSPGSDVHERVDVVAVVPTSGRHTEDAAHAGAFALNALLFAIVCAIGQAKASTEYWIYPPHTSFIATLLIVSLICAPLCGMQGPLLCLLLPRHDRMRIVAYASMLLFAAWGILLLLLWPEHWLAAALCLLVCVYDAMWTFWRAQQFPFAECVVTVAASLLRPHMGVLLVTAGGAVVQLLGLGLWCVAMLDLLRTSPGSFSAALGVSYLLMCLYWFTGLVRDVVGFVAAGAASATLLAPPGQQPDRAVAWQLLRVALTKSLGSLCLLALMAGGAHLLWSLPFILLPLERALPACATFRRAVTLSTLPFVQAFHRHTLPVLARRGGKLAPTGRATWAQFQQRGVHGVLHDDCASRLLRMSTRASGAALACIFVLLSSTSDQFPSWIVLMFAAYCVGASVSTVVLSPLHAALDAMVVCFAERPESLSATHPVVFHRYMRVSEVYQMDPR